MPDVTVKERPILMSGEFVRAILDGRKTQTRRVVKWEPREEGLNLQASSLVAGHYCTGATASGWVLRSRGGGGCWNDRTHPIHCPYGVPGDLLYVRETWAAHLMFDDVPPSEMPGDDRHCLWYRADGDETGSAVNGCHEFQRGRWRPSIHMPKWATRLWLRVTDVRVERVQEITEGDAKAEGVATWEMPDHGRTSYTCPGVSGTHAVATARGAFSLGWDALNTDRGYSWDSNPWVWVVSFRVAQERHGGGSR